jgi:hypothetical protein
MVILRGLQAARLLAVLLLTLKKFVTTGDKFYDVRFYEIIDTYTTRSFFSRYIFHNARG